MRYGKRLLSVHRTAAGVALMLLVACAPTRVDSVKEYSGKDPLPKPDVVRVSSFAITPEDISPDSAPGQRLKSMVIGVSKTEEQIKIGHAAANVLADELVKSINEMGLRAERATGTEKPVGNVLAIEGQFTSIDEGNRARRLMIGFGVGGSVVRAHVQVYHGAGEARRLVEVFETDAQSSKKPGVGPMAGVGGAATGAASTAAVSGGVGAATELDQTIEGDARRTAREIAKTLSRFFAGQGWITK